MKSGKGRDRMTITEMMLGRESHSLIRAEAAEGVRGDEILDET